MKLMSPMCLVLPLLLNAVGPDSKGVALCNAARYGAKVKECLIVKDQNGRPVADAKVWGGLQTGDGYNDYIPIEGSTDTNGEFIVEGKCTNRLSLRITKIGYYKGEFIMSYHDTTATPKVLDGKWQPFGTCRTIILKKQIGNWNLSVPDKKRHMSWQIPIYDKWLAYDLEKFDWCYPYGVGEHEDVLLFFTKYHKSWSEFKFTMDVSFTNNLFAGAYLMKKDESSDFKTTYLADTNATFQSSFHYIRERTADRRRNFICLKQDDYLVFRTRTTVEEGILNEAYYGVIQGIWAPDLESMELEDGCFNPIPNDMNIEDWYYLRKKVQWSKESKQ